MDHENQVRHGDTHGDPHHRPADPEEAHEANRVPSLRRDTRHHHVCAGADERTHPSHVRAEAQRPREGLNLQPLHVRRHPPNHRDHRRGERDVIHKR